MSRDFILYQQQVAESFHNTEFMVRMSTSKFMHGVHSACWMIQNFFDPESKSYIPPRQNAFSVQNDWDAPAEEFAWRNAFIRDNAHRDFYGHHLYLLALEGFEQIQAYVLWRNTNEGNIVGEQWWTASLVYRTLALLHNYNVKLIEAEHNANGRHFGSATMFQRESCAKDVKDWPTKMPRSEIIPVAMFVMPCDRPGYMEGA